ncbi:MAG: hypothetical protein ACQEWV_11185 [Bacillota bacterium]
MVDKCFYCDYEIEYGIVYHVTFLKDQDEHEKSLCDFCYAEWLEGIKE